MDRARRRAPPDPPACAPPSPYFAARARTSRASRSSENICLSKVCVLCTSASRWTVRFVAREPAAHARAASACASAERAAASHTAAAIVSARRVRHIARPWARGIRRGIRRARRYDGSTCTPTRATDMFYSWALRRAPSGDVVLYYSLARRRASRFLCPRWVRHVRNGGGGPVTAPCRVVRRAADPIYVAGSF